MPKSKVQDMTEVRRWFEEGRTYDWMIEQYEKKYHIDTTRSMWSNLRKRHGWEPRVLRDENLIPWRVAQEHEQAYPVMMLRAEARRRAGRTVSPDLRERLESWKVRLEEEGAVVYYDRELGFFYVPREAGDDDIIRRPQAVREVRT